MHIRVSDIVLIITVLAVCCTPLLFLIKEEGKTASISVDGVLKYTLNLNENGEKQLGELGKIIVENGGIYIYNSSCHDHSCEKMGKISKVGQTIICLPKKIVIKILGDAEVDAVAE